jgi:hypothetical protein
MQRNLERKRKEQYKREKTGLQLCFNRMAQKGVAKSRLDK